MPKTLKIRDIRRAIGDTQTQFAARLQVHYCTVLRWEHGYNTPHPRELSRLEKLKTEIEAKNAL